MMHSPEEAASLRRAEGFIAQCLELHLRRTGRAVPNLFDESGSVDAGSRLASFKSMGLDSLDWMAVATIVENGLGTDLPNSAFDREESLTVAAWAKALGGDPLVALNPWGAGRPLLHPDDQRLEFVPDWGSGSGLQLTDSGERYRVYDNLLSPDEVEQLNGILRATSFEMRESTIEAQSDGPAQRSRPLRLRHSTSSASGRPAVYMKILEMVRHSDFFGKAGDDWHEVSFSAWNYPAGSRLSWHNDAGGGRQGAFVYFAHSVWDASWGGELLIVDQDAREVRGVREGSDQPRTDIGQLLVDQGVSPVAIIPRPNRLVLFPSETFHTIARVDPSAGDNLRRTVTGFVSAVSGSGGPGRDWSKIMGF